jgi:WhiB family redox-sensing transcriptional regulator
MPTVYEGLAQRGTPPVTRHRDIACYDTNPELFFPKPGVVPHEALEICGGCRHQDECLDWALETGQAYGVWGGTTPAERVRILERGEA